MFRGASTVGIGALIMGLLFGACAMAGDIAVVMGAGAPALTKAQVADVYLGRSIALRPLDLPAADPAHDSFYRRATDRDAAQIKAVWARIIFTGQGQPPAVKADAATVKKTVAGDPRTIGYIDKSDVDAGVNVVLTLP